MQPKQNPAGAKRRHLAIAVIALAALLLPAFPAGAIIGSSTPDDVRPYDYPYVGGVWKIKDNGNAHGGLETRVRSNGILIADNVVLTVGDSYENGNRVAVSFESPIPVEQERQDPTHRGHLFEFCAECDFPFPLPNLAVIILDEPVPSTVEDPEHGVDPVTLAGVDTLDQEPLTVVSYGPTDSNGSSDFTRRVATGWGLTDLLTSDPAHARLAVPDDGLTCFGDNGGPILLESGDIVAMIENFFFAEESICNTPGVAYAYRLDTPEVRKRLCFVSKTNLDGQKVKDPAHNGKVVNYPDLTAASKARLATYCDGGAKQSADHHHNGKHRR